MPGIIRVSACALLAVLFSTAFVCAARADGLANTLVDATKPALAAGVAAALVCSKDDGPERAARTVDAILLAGGVADLMKSNLSLSTKDGIPHRFPSAHTATAFAAASSLSHVYPKAGFPLYATAALIGWSTIAVNGHSWVDVLGGAALGIAAGNWSISSRNGLMIGRAFRF